MKAKPLILVAGMALAANVGFAQAAELAETAEMPEILGSMETASYQAMSNVEMERVSGEAVYILGIKVWDRRKTHWDVYIGPYIQNWKIKGVGIKFIPNYY